MGPPERSVNQRSSRISEKWRQLVPGGVARMLPGTFL